MKLLIKLAIIGWLFSATAIHAKNYYRYQNRAGSVVVKDYLPNEAIASGYDIISDSGRVIDTIPAFITAEQALVERIKAEQLKVQEVEAKKRRQRDALLLRQYRTTDDIERTKQSQTATLKINLRIVASHTRSLNRKLVEQEKRAADYERRGKTVPEATLYEIAAIKNQISANDESVKRYENEIVEIGNSYEADKERFTELKADQVAVMSENVPTEIQIEGSYICEDVTACDKAWKYAQIFAHQNASHRLTIITDTLIVSESAKSEQDIALSMVRVPVDNTSRAMSIVIEVKCFSSNAGKAKCQSKEVAQLKRDFVNYIASKE